MSRAMELNSFHLLSCALVFTLFLFQKGQGFFPPLPIAALLPRSWRWADSNGGAWDAPMRLRWFRSAGKQVCFFAVGAIHTPIAPLGILQNGLDIFAKKKPAWSSIHADLFMRAMRPVAEWRSFLSN